MGLPGGHCIWHLAHLHQSNRRPDSLRLVRQIAQCCCVEARGGAQSMVMVIRDTQLNAVSWACGTSGTA